MTQDQSIFDSFPLSRSYSAERAEDRETRTSLAGEALDALKPGIYGIAARTAYIGVTGDLHLSPDAFRRQFEAMDTSVSHELVRRLDDLRDNRWQFMKTAPGQHPGSFDYKSRRIFYQAQGSMFQYALGLEVNPVKQTLPIIAHEVAHHGGVPYWSSNQLTTEERTVLLSRKVEAETTSMLAEAHVADELNIRDNRPWNVSTEPRREAIRTGTLGRYIMDTHFQPGRIDDRPFNKITNGMIDTVYGGNIVDIETGKVRDFDLRASFGRTITNLSSDGEGRLAAEMHNYRVTRLDPDRDLRTSFDKIFHAGESDARASLMTVGKGAGALAVLAIATDLPGAFAEGPASGAGRLAKVGVDWAGYGIAAHFANTLVEDVRLRRPGLSTIPVVAIGLIGAYVTNKVAGEIIEEKVKNTF